MKTNRAFLHPAARGGGLRKTSLSARRGQTLVEYAMIIALIVIVILALVSQLGTTLKGLYSSIDSQVARAPGGS